jgi:hypothetical protein
MWLHRLFFYLPALYYKMRTTQYKKSDDHGDNRITKPGSKKLTQHPRSVNSDDVPPLATIMARCPNPHIAQQPLPLKKHQFSHKFVECANLFVFHTPTRKAGPFLTLPTPVSHSLDCHLM